jgi:hypothetical protein
MRRALLLPALLLLTACAPYTIKYDYDPGAPFATMKTFDWFKPKKERVGDAPPRLSEFNDRRVRAAVEKEMATKGLRKETSADPDVVLDYFPVYKDRAYRTHTSVGVGGGPWGWGWGWRTRVGTTQVHHYKEGSIVLQVVDFKTNKLIWEGVAEGALTDVNGTPEEAEEAIGQAVRDLLAHFPPARR